MRTKRQLLMLLSMFAFHAYAQQDTPSPSLDVGDPAPALYVQEWVKGSPIQQMEKGRIYVVEFWATWCKPCIAAMPHLSALAVQHKDKVSVIAMNIYEEEGTPPQKIRAFVDSMGSNMDYHVAIDDNTQMVDKWLNASEEKRNGIPRTFVVNPEGRLAWIGYPKDLDSVLQKMVNDDWDIDKELENRKEQRRLEILESKAGTVIGQFKYDEFNSEIERTEATLLKIDEIIKEEPKLENTRAIVRGTFSSLLKVNQEKAYEYGISLLSTTDLYSVFYEAIKWNRDELDLLPQIYQLGAEAYQEKINQLPYPEIVDISRYYNEMASWYWLAGNAPKAIAAQRKAIEALKHRKKSSASDLAAFESQLQQYIKESTI